MRKPYDQIGQEARSVRSQYRQFSCIRLPFTLSTLENCLNPSSFTGIRSYTLTLRLMFLSSISQNLVKYRRYHRHASIGDKDEDEDGIEDFNYETPEELQQVRSSGDQEAVDVRSLRSYRALQHLKLSIYSLYYFACGIGFNLDLSDLSSSLAEYFPPHLESLQLFVPDAGEKLKRDSPMFFCIVTLPS